MKSWCTWPVMRPWTTIAVVAATTLFFAVNIPTTGQRPVFEGMPPEDPWVMDDAEFMRLFGAPNSAVFMVTYRGDGGILSPGGLALLHDFTERAKDFPWRRSSVMSFLSRPDVRVTEEEIAIRYPVTPEMMKDEEAVRRLKADLMDDPGVRGKLISKSEMSAIVRFAVDDAAPQKEMAQAVDELITPYAAPHGEVRIASFVKHHMNEEIEQGTVRDIMRLIPVAILAMVVLSSFVLPLLSWVPIVASVVGTTLGSFGLMALLDVPRSVLSLPVVLILSAVLPSASFHYMVLARRLYTPFERGEGCSREGGTKRRRETALLRAFEHMRRPILVAIITTVAAFLVLYRFEILSVREFAYYVSAGFLLGAVHVFLLVPAIIMVLPRWQHPVEARPTWIMDRVSDLHEKLVSFWERAVFYRTKTLWAAIGTLLLAGVAGLFLIHVDSDLLTLYPEESYSRRSFKEMVSEFGGTGVIRWGFRSEDKEYLVYDPHFFSEVHRFSHWAEEVPGVVAAYSITDDVVRLHEAYTGVAQVPRDPRRIYRYLEQDYATVARDQLAYNVTDDRTHMAVDFFVNATSARRLGEIGATLKLEADRRFGAHANFISGEFPMWSRQTPYIGGSQLANVLLAISLVAVVFAVFYRSAWAMLGAVPVAATNVVIYGSMGAAGINLDLAGSVVSFLAIGVGADFAAHFLEVLVREAKGRRSVLLSVPAVVRDAVFSGGVPIQYNAMAVASLGVLALSEFPPLVNFAMLAVPALLLSTAFTLTLLPALIVFLSRKGFRITFITRELAKGTKNPRVRFVRIA